MVVFMISENSMVVHSNQITRAAYRLSVVESRIILSAISRIPRNVKPSDDALYWCTSSDLVDLGSDPKSVYKQLREASDLLFDRAITLPTEEGSRKFRWVQEVFYEPANGRIGLRFSKPMLPFLTEVQSAFTKYKLLDIKGLTSEYAIRLYAMCAQYADTHWMSMTIKDLREALELGSKYSGLTMFKAKVLDSAIKQINESEHTAFTVKYKLSKTGRTYTDIKFTITPKSKSKASEEKTLQLSEKQAFYFASKLLDDQSVWNAFYGVARRAGLDLQGMSDGFACAEKTAKWLSDPAHAKLSIEYLKKVGFNVPD
jgi:plasmid replication initiation protein